jgi:molybdopterin-binding protein
MKVSARNVLPGEVASVLDGAVNSKVDIRLPSGTIIVASITRDSVKKLNLTLGVAVSAIIKSSNVLIGA